MPSQDRHPVCAPGVLGCMDCAVLSTSHGPRASHEETPRWAPSSWSKASRQCPTYLRDELPGRGKSRRLASSLNEGRRHGQQTTCGAWSGPAGRFQKGEKSHMSTAKVTKVTLAQRSRGLIAGTLKHC